MNNLKKLVPSFFELSWSYLIAKDADGAGRGDLVCGEPGGGQLGGDAQDEDLAGRHHRLPREGHPPLVRARPAHLHSRHIDHVLWFNNSPLY